MKTLPAVSAAVSITAAILLASQKALELDLAAAQQFASWQFIAAVAFMFATATSLHRTVIHPYIFFLLTSCLFVGGRFYAHALGFSEPLFFNHGFELIDLDAQQAMNLMSHVTPAYLGVHAGYLAFFAWRNDNNAVDGPAPLPTQIQKSLWIPAAAMLAVFVPMAAYGQFGQFSAACLSGDYISLYSSKAEFGLRLVSLAQYGLLLSLGLSLASGNRTVLAISMVSLGLYYLASLGFGIRSGFLSFALLATWVVHKRVRQLTWRTMLVVPVLMLVLAQGSEAFSCRTAMATTPEIAASASARTDHFVTSVSEPNRILKFAHDQGTSLLSIHIAAEVKGYPWPSFVQTFVPGFGAVASLLGHPIPLSDLYFGQYMASQWIDPDRYARGEGFGWSLVSDFIVFSGGMPPLLVAFAALTGAAFAALVSAAQTNAMWFGALGVIVPKIALLPRAGVTTIIPYIVAFLIIYLCWWIVLRAFGRKSAAGYQQV